jgi:hypothetical protein
MAWGSRQIPPTKISKFWDGKKLKEYQAFWDLDTTWEALVMCTRNDYEELFQAFPQPCQELIDNWDEITSQVYHFQCLACLTNIQCGKKTILVIQLTFNRQFKYLFFDKFLFNLVIFFITSIGM